MTAIDKLRDIQNTEVENGFLNGGLWNDLEDMIYKIENNLYNVEFEKGELYAGKTMEQIIKSK